MQRFFNRIAACFGNQIQSRILRHMFNKTGFEMSNEKSNVLHLANSSQRERSCGCRAPVHNQVLLRDPVQAFYTLVQPCGRCGELEEIDTSALGSYMAGTLQVSRPACDCCGNVEGLASAELQMPDGSRSWGYLCSECISDRDEELMILAGPY
jgi:hypothetical protein